MPYKEVLVVLDPEPGSAERISVAAAIAERFEARLIGLYVAINLELPGRFEYFEIGAPLLRSAYRDMDAIIEADAEKARALFEANASSRRITSEWRKVCGNPAELAAGHGRYADLIVIGQLNPDDTLASINRPRPEEVVLLAGRPVLVVPYVGTFATVGQRIGIGWDAGREATRAINDAIPLLAAASSVTVMTVDQKIDGARHGQVPGADIALYLARHGVTATVDAMTSSGIGVGDTLLSRASDIGADLLVMGAYGHSRVRELLLGGATRTVLRTMTLPVLMSH